MSEEKALERIEYQLGLIARDLGSLSRRFDEHRGQSNDKLVEIRRAVDDVANDRLNDREENARYRRRIKDVEREVERLSEQADGPSWSRDPINDTGVHHIEDIQKRLDEADARKRDSEMWWKRQRYVWAMAIVIPLLLAAMTGCAAVVAKHLVVIERPAPPAK